MKRVVLLVGLGLATWAYFPETRAMLARATEPLIVPILRGGAEEEMARIARNVVEHERLTRSVPAQGEWLGWLEARYSSREDALDPWGTYYQLEVTDDSVCIVSYGPDRTWRTDDDFHVTAPRG